MLISLIIVSVGAAASVGTLGLVIYRLKKEKKLQADLERLRNDLFAMLSNTQSAIESALSGITDATREHLKVSADENKETLERITNEMTNCIGSLEAKTAHLQAGFEASLKASSENIQSALANNSQQVEKSVSDIRDTIERKMQIALEKILEEFYRVQAERLALVAQRGEFMQFSETLEKVFGTLQETTRVIEAAAKKGRTINEALAKGQAGMPENNVVAFAAKSKSY